MREEQELIMFLQSLGISESFAADIRKRYGGETEDVLSGDPYRMVRDIPGLGFQEVDRIALAKGVDPDDADRVTKGIEYTIPGPWPRAMPAPRNRRFSGMLPCSLE